MNERITFPRTVTQSFTCFTDYPLTLESGKTLGPITLAYETYGTLNADKDNVILVLHALTGDAHCAGESAEPPHAPGWWSGLIGPGKSIDTDRYFVLCSNVIGGCKGSTGPQSINPATGEPYGLAFPVITIGDMVNVQRELIRFFGIATIKLVIGGSMGGMQALEWVAMYPEMVEKCLPMASTSQVSPQALAYDTIGRHAIMADPNWKDGTYYNAVQGPEIGLAIARMIGHITYLSEESMMIKFGRGLQQRPDYGYDFETDFKVESYLKHQGQKFVNRFDANSYLYITKAVDYFDMPKKYGSLENALSATNARFLIIAIASDILYPPAESRRIAKTLMKLGKEVTYAELDSPLGHDAFLLDDPALMQIIHAFLEQEAG